MRILQIVVGNTQPPLVALQRECRMYTDDEPTVLTANSEALLRKYLCVDAKTYDLVLLIGEQAMCRKVVSSLVDASALYTLTDGMGADVGFAYARFGRCWASIPADADVCAYVLHERLMPTLTAEEGDAPKNRTVGIYGLSGEALRLQLHEILESEMPLVTLYPCGLEWRLRIFAAGVDEQAMDAVVSQSLTMLGRYAYGVDCADLTTRVTELLQETALTVATADQCADDDTVNVSQDIPQSAKGAVCARLTQGTILGVSLTSEKHGQMPSVTVAVADDTRVWWQTVSADTEEIAYESAKTELLDILRRYMEAYPAVMAGGETWEIEKVPVTEIPVTPLQKDRPLLFRRTKSRSEKIFKICLFALIGLMFVVLGWCVWLFTRSSNTALTFKELDALYQTAKTDVNAGDYPEGMLPRFYALYNENVDIRGWIRLDTHHSYPIMNGRNDTDYSQKGFNKQDSADGVPYFLPALPSRTGKQCLIVYGNSTNDGDMFSVLSRYMDADYAREHAVVEMNTIYETAQWQMFSVLTLPTQNNTFNYTRTAFKDEADFMRFVGELTTRSLFDISTQVCEGDRLLLLTTVMTDANGMQQRVLVAFRMMKTGDTVQVEVTDKTTALPSDTSDTIDSEAPQDAVTDTDENSSLDEEKKPVNGGDDNSAEDEEDEDTPDVNDEEGGTEFVPPDEEEEPKPTSPTTTKTTTKSTKTTTKSTKTTTTTKLTSTTSSATEATEGTVSSTAQSGTTVTVSSDGSTTSVIVSSTSSTSATTKSTTKSTVKSTTESTTSSTTATEPSVYTPTMIASTANESEYMVRFRLKDSSTGEKFIPTTREELQLGLFYLVKYELGMAASMKYSTEAQKAQAVASYTYVLYYCQGGKSYYSFNFPSYNPNNATDKKIYKACGEVVGVKMINPSKSLAKQPINAMYSCASAGVSSSCNKVYTASLPYLVSVESPYDTDAYIKKYSNNSNALTAEFTITLDTFMDLLADEMGISAEEIESEAKKDMPVYAKSWDGGKGYYVYKTNLYYYNGGEKTYILGKDVRDAIKSETGMRSHAFEVTAYDKETDMMTIKTKGYGHGLGLSQYGAVGFANEAGWTYDQILAHFYSISDDTAYQLAEPTW